MTEAELRELLDSPAFKKHLFDVMRQQWRDGVAVGMNACVDAMEAIAATHDRIPDKRGAELLRNVAAGIKGTGVPTYPDPA